MSDEKPEELVSDDRKAWETPELIVEEVRRVTQGGTGTERNLATEDRVTTYYMS